MKKIIFLLLILATPLYAGDKYIVSNEDGSVGVVTLAEGEIPAVALSKLETTDVNDVVKITDEDLPGEEDRAFWTRNTGQGKKIKIDNAKKQEFETEQAALQATRQSLMDKLQASGFTKGELKEMFSNKARKHLEAMAVK